MIGVPVLLAALWLGPAVDGGPALSPRNASYDMDVRLDPGARTLHGTQTLSWTNTTRHATQELRYHLYYNAWRDRSSSYFVKGRGLGYDLSHVRDGEWGSSDVGAVVLVDDAGEVLADLADATEFIAPDDDNPDDRTVLRVALPEAVPPGGHVRVRLEWTAHVPRTFARTGVRGDYFFVAQWFPKVGVFEPDGAWNCHQFIRTEFYADFGVYDVRLTVPADWVVGATGRKVDKTDNGDGTTTHRHVQADVHDFAWTTAPDTIVYTERFEHDDLPGVDMRLLLRPDRDDGRHRRYFDATAAALQYYGTWWGAYPYGHVTIVDPAYEAGSGGMEYPTLFTGGGRWLAPRLGRQPEGVTVHEAGHQFWYGIMANNEFEHAWLDEGFNTYSTTRTMQAAFPERGLVERYLEGFVPVTYPAIVPDDRTDGADRHRGFTSALKRDPQRQPSYTTGPHGYRVNAYDKGALTLRTLENYLGWPTFQAVMSTYFARYRFKHPTPQDFFRTAEQVAGVDLEWFFEQVWGQSVVFDYAVGEVQAARVPDEETWRSVVHVRRWGEGVYPVLVDITFADDSRVVEQWDGRDRWVRFAYERDAEVKRVRVDPNGDLVLDVDRTNNSWLRKSKAGPASTKWASKWMLWVQASMEAFAFFS